LWSELADELSAIETLPAKPPDEETTDEPKLRPSEPVFTRLPCERVVLPTVTLVAVRFNPRFTFVTTDPTETAPVDVMSPELEIAPDAVKVPLEVILSVVTETAPVVIAPVAVTPPLDTISPAVTETAPVDVTAPDVVMLSVETDTSPVLETAPVVWKTGFCKVSDCTPESDFIFYYLQGR